MTSPSLPPAIAALGRQIASMQAQIAQLQRNQRTSQLGSSSIDNGALIINDPTGAGQMLVGLQGDGTYTTVSTSTVAPPVAPDTPVVAGGPLSVLVTWDGLAGGLAPLNDFAACQVHCSAVPGFTPSPATLAGHLTGAGLFGVGGLTALTTYYVALVIVNEAGLASPASAEASATAQAALPAGSTVEGVYFIAGGGGGTTWPAAEPGSPGYYLYWDTGTGNPQVVYSATALAGSDQWGGTWQGGSTYVGLPGVLPNVLTVTDTTGDVLAGIDSSGNITGATVNAATDVLVGGQSLAQFMTDTPSGVVARGWTPGTSGVFWPASGITSGAAVAVLELDFTAQAGRDYMLQVLPGTVLFSSPPAGTGQYVQRLFYTTDGTTPSTSSAEVSGHSPAITSPVLSSAVLNYPTPYQEYLIPIPAAETTYRFLLAAYATGGSYELKYSNAVEMRVTDLGVSTGQFTNAGVVLGTGTTGGGAGPQTYTETVYAANTWNYRNVGGLTNTNGTCYHGSPNVGGAYWNYSYIAWGAAPSGRNLYTILSHYTVNWATIRLTCKQSFYSNGLRFGLHSSTSLGGGSGVYSVIVNPGGWFIGEGATTAYQLTSAQWTALFAASTYTVLSPDSADLYTLTWDGSFAGGGAPDSSTPAITVSYTG